MESEEKYYYTKKYQKEQEILNTKSLNKSPNNYKIFFKLLLLVIALLISGYFISKKQEKHFLFASGKTNAIVTKVVYNNRLVNQMDGERIRNYVIEYSYWINGKEIKSFYQVDEYEYYDYFDKKLQIGDSIVILYQKDNISTSKIKKH